MASFHVFSHPMNPNNTKPAAKQKMGYFARLFARWAGHQHAPVLLAIISFIEASFFPIPPYAMLIPMCIAKPEKAKWFALVGTVASTLGGLLGYAIGHFAADWSRELIAQWGYTSAFAATEAFFKEWGGLSILVSAISPLPYKVMTITSGLFGMNIAVFILTSLLARGLRFYVAALTAAKATEVIQKRMALDQPRSDS